MAFWVYILASDRNGTLYTGHTDQLARRMWEHREKIRPGFTSKYSVTKLVWYEAHPTRESAKIREGRIKEWKRVWKLRMVDQFNPEWRDFYLNLHTWYSPDLKV